MPTTSRFDRAEFVGGPHDGAEFVSTTIRLSIRRRSETSKLDTPI